MSVPLFKSFVNRLVPNFEKGRVLDVIDGYRQEYQETVKSPLNNIVRTIGTSRPMTQEIKAYAEKLEAGVENKRDYPYMVVVEKAMAKLPGKLDMLERQCDIAFSHSVVAGSLSFDGATILRYLEGIGFALSYSRRLMLRTLQLETDYNRNRSDEAVKAEVKYLQENIGNFVSMLNVLNGNAQRQESLIKEIPNINISDETAAHAVGTVGYNSVDPLQMGILPPRLNPVFYIARAWSDFQFFRYERAKDEKTQLENRLLDYRDSAEDQENPRVRKAIEVYDARIQKLDARIRRFEGSV